MFSPERFSGPLTRPKPGGCSIRSHGAGCAIGNLNFLQLCAFFSAADQWCITKHHSSSQDRCDRCAHKTRPMAGYTCIVDGPLM
jgi:hypothetical protein